MNHQTNLSLLSNSTNSSGLGNNGIMNSDDEKVVQEFCHLLEKSKQLFNGLRDLPPYGHKQWQGYFGRTFDIYTKLWKFQQQHRVVLDTRYGLKRWQIGEIASKIGQLYYHYYLRTSETNYLNEAFSFYAAIRGRAYFSRALREERPDMMVKKLRYYARFIVVCLLLKKMKLVRDLSRELSKQIEEYNTTFDPEDRLEWSLVLGEVRAFIEADSIVNILDSDSNSIVLSHRLNPLITPPVEKTPSMSLTLQEVILVGSKSEQAKFSELTLDMFRILQTLEREPQEDMMQLYDATSPAVNRTPFENGGSAGSANGSKRDNPHKYLLYKPTVSQFLVFISSGIRELPCNGALMLYISGDGFNTVGVRNPNPNGGILLTSKRDPLSEQYPNLNNKLPMVASSQQEINCLYPSDLLPFLRRPMFLVIDSENSRSFATNFHNQFDQPFLVLMSPQSTPEDFIDESHKGGLYSLFLHSPLSAFCFVTNIVDIPIHLWDKCLAYIDRFLTEASRLLTRCRGVDSSFLSFMGDDFLRLLVCRHIFASVVLRVHKSFLASPHFPSSNPILPELEILENPTLQRYAVDLANQLEVKDHFIECGEVD